MSSTTGTGNTVRVIATGAPPERFARGWHCLGLLRDFSDDRPHQVSAFGTELVVFRGDDGKLNVLNAFCPQMGGNLAHGTVKGDDIACPFHDWRWRGDGKCAAIPYARRVPPLARIYMIDKLWSGGRAGAGAPNMYLINCHYPITSTSFRLQYGVTVEKPTGMDDAAAEQVAAAVAHGIAIGFEQDVEVWKNKSRIDNPLLCEEDGPVYQLRRWYEQFYVDVEDIAPEMVNRFEFEIDTERALQNWQAEVDANLAAGRSAIPDPRQAAAASS